MSEPFVGEVRMFGGNFAPRGWAFCDGQLLAIAQNDALFSLLGTIYGGDGRTTFGLPDLRSRVPLHAGSGPGLTPRQLGARGGSEQVTITANELPSHDHGPMQFSTGAGVSNDPTESIPANSPSVDLWIEDQQTTGLDASAVSISGGGQQHANVMPFMCVYFIIALFGIYPSRT